jgi:hypothetical protein
MVSVMSTRMIRVSAPGLDSAPGRLDEGGLAAVLPHDAHPELAGHALAPRLVRGEHCAGETVLRGVGHRYCLLLP